MLFKWLLLPKMYFKKSSQSYLGNLTSDSTVVVDDGVVAIANDLCVGITLSLSQIWRGKRKTVTTTTAATTTSIEVFTRNNHAFTLTPLFNTFLDLTCSVCCYIYNCNYYHFVHLILDHIKYLLVKRRI